MHPLFRSHAVIASLGGSAAEIEQQLEAVPRACAAIELRADRLEPDALRALVQACGGSVIVTARRAEDGGAFHGDEAARRRLLLDALDSGADLVDVELGSELAGLADGPQAERLILSHHDAPCELETLLGLWREARARPVAAVKLVPHAQRPADAAVLRELLETVRREPNPPLIAFAQGRYGRLSRVLAPAWGSAASYGAPARGAETAAGQLTVDELLETYGVAALGPATRLFALVGRDVGRSPSPAMHNAALRALALDAVYVAVDASRVDDALALADCGLPLDGFAVTMPFKEAFAARARPGDPVAERARTVNTVRIDREGWVGYNTDADAVLELAGRMLPVAGCRAAVVGAGGTGRAAAAALQQAGAEVCVFNRGSTRRDRVARDLNVRAAALDALPAAGWDLLVQTTPLGKRGERLVDRASLTGRAVIDVVYGIETPLLRDASAAGLSVAGGDAFLHAQAVRQFERLTGRRGKLPAAERRRA